VENAATYLTLEKTRYDMGLDPYVDLVIAETTSYSNQQQLANLQIQRMSASVALIEALGGGWDRSQLPSPAQITQKPPRLRRDPALS